MQICLKSCRSCRDWSNCPGHEWYSMSDWCWCRPQVLWMIEQFFGVHGTLGVVLGRESWPAEGRASGYTEAPKTSHSVNSHASFERPMQLVGELEHRLLKTGKDGRLLVLEVHVHNACNTTGRDLSQDARAAQGYFSVWKRKRLGYVQWQAEKTRQNHRKYGFAVPLDKIRA